MADSNISILRTLKLEDSKLAGKVTTDTGGLTKWGISQKAFPKLDIANLTIDDAKKIYKASYWDKMFLDKIKNQTLADAIYDFAVNAGISKAIKTAQEACSLVGKYTKDDGKMGPQTLKTLNSVIPKDWIKMFVYLRIKFYTQLAEKPEYKIYLKGWTARANSFLE